MALTHGVNASKLKTSVSTPIKVDSGVHFAVGAAPVQMVGGKTNEVIMANDYEEAAWRFTPRSRFTTWPR